MMRERERKRGRREFDVLGHSMSTADGVLVIRGS